MTEEELSGLLGPSIAPPQKWLDTARDKGGSPTGEEAIRKMHMRDRVRWMLHVMRRNSEQNANLYNREDLPLEMMEQRNIDPRDYGADSPTTPLIPMQSQDREWESVMEDMGRWNDQLSQRKRDMRYNFDREEWIDPPPPQLTGRFRDRMAF